MPTMTIPDEHASGLMKIMELSQEDSQKVATALGKVRSLNVRDLTALVQATVPSLLPNDAREIVQTLLSLYSVRTGTETTIDAFVAELLAAAKQI